MSASTDSAPVSPFLAFVSPQDRSPMRVGLWLALGLPLAFFGFILVGGLAHVLEPGLLDRLQQPGGITGPHRLLFECAILGVQALAEITAALALLGAAQLAFQRPAWTFVSPARPFAFKLLAAGLIVYGVLTAASLGLDAAQGAGLVPPVLDLGEPATDRLAYGLASLPLILLAAAAEELAFRGALLQVTSAFVRTRIGLCVVNGLVFAALHLQANPIVFLELALTGGVFAYSVLELGGIEFSLGAHFANNLLLLMLQEPLSAAGGGAAFRWSDLATTSTLIDLGEMTGTALATLAAVRLIKRLREKARV
jgi:membrane protease YdiL (CAAX protease family)